MKSEKPKTPRQELEASLTALLLGELPEQKAAALRESMAKDAELARLYERLEQTIGLVRETAVPAEQGTQSAPLKLSTKRREQLLQQFKTIAPKEFTNPKSRTIRARELAIAAGIVAFIGFAAWFTFNLTQGSYSSMSRIKVESEPNPAMVASYSPSPVASTPPPVADHSLTPVQSPTVVTASADGGGLSVSSAAKPSASEIALPTATDFYINGKDPSASLVSTNYTFGDPEWVGVLDRGNYSPSAHSSTNQFVSRYASIALPTNTELGDKANLASAPQGQFVANRTPTNASEFALNADPNRNGQFGPQGTFYDSSKSGSQLTAGFGRTGTPMTYANSGQITGALQQLDENFRRQSGGLAWADKIQDDDVGIGKDSGQEFRRKLKGILNRAASTPEQQPPAIDPATGLPIPASGAYSTGAIDPATGLPIPAEVAEVQQKMPTPVPLATRAFQVETNAFFAALEPFKEAASQAPYGGGGTGGGGGGGGRVTVSGQMPARTLREPALTPTQTPAVTTPPMAGQKLVETAQEGKDVNASNIYLGKELAKSDVKFGTWSLETAQAARSSGTKKEEEKLKQVAEVRDGVTIAGRATTPGQGFSPVGPRETPPSPSASLQPQSVPVLGDLPMLGAAFKGGEANPGLTSAKGVLSVPSANSIETFGAVLAGVPVASPSGYIDGNGQWQFTTGTENLGWVKDGETNVTLFAGEPSNQSSDSFYFHPGLGTQANWVQNFTVDAGVVVAPETKPAQEHELVARQSMVDIEKDWLKRNTFGDSNAIRSRGTDRGEGELSDALKPTKVKGQFSPGGQMPSITNDAIISIDPETRGVVVIGDADTSNYIAQAMAKRRGAETNLALSFANPPPPAAVGQMGAPFKESEELSRNRSNDREMITRVIHVDKNTFRQGLESINGLVVGGFTTSGPPDSGVRVVTRTNDMSTLQADTRKFFKTMGVDLNTDDGKSVFYNDRDGTLLVRGTRGDLDVIESAVSVLNQPAPEVNIAAKFAETSSNQDLALATPAVPNPYARTNLIWTSSGREIISRKLDKIMVNSLKYEGLPLSEVIRNLNEEAKKRDPEKRGINFILNPDQISKSDTSKVLSPIDPATGLPMVSPTEAVDLGAARVKIVPELRDVRLEDVLDAIVKTSDRPIKYSIEDYAVVFSRAGSAADWEDPKVPAKPVTPPLIPQPEIQTRENAFSTFSLNVSDVAFKLAAASLEKGQMPEPASIRSEEFINAFDYRDPEAPAGVPVAFAWERARYPYAQNRDLMRLSIKTAAQGRQTGRPLNLVLLLDNSGSMERADRVAIIREALKVLASQLQPQDKLSVITFARTAQLRVDGVAGNQAAQVAEDIGGLTPEGGTNIEEAMNLAYQTALRHYLASGINRVVLLTDGAANLGDVEPGSLKQKVEANRKQGIALDCFGIGWEGFNDDLLETLSRNGDGRYGFINSPEEAATEFAGQLAGALNVAASDVKVQVEFNPARVTAYRQIGYAKHQLTKEQFRDNTVDAAEIAAQEAGNALYVVEVNPAGQGPLGTVRVRFKIPGTSDYREHEWSVPFNGNAVALEQASPAMRLAATASAFSEWLATSPYATEVTPDTLLSYLSGVPEVYGADARPKKLEWMIRQAKSLAGK
jgi:Mg-chelatase subunit ChlD